MNTPRIGVHAERRRAANPHRAENSRMPGAEEQSEALLATEDGPALTVAVLARRLGVAPATLRTWDRRYGLGPSEHAAGAHRRYAPSDVARLDVMRRLTREGVSPGEAARVALLEPAHGRATPAEAPPPTDSSSVGAPDGRVGGGRVIPLPGGSPATRGLARAAMALDAHGVSDLVDASLERRGVMATWDHLLVPVLVAAGMRWETTGEGVEVEHLLAECITGSLHSVIARIRRPLNPRPVLLASAENELHALPLHALAAALAERQVAGRILGARTPGDALAAAVRRSGPAAVFVWSQSPTTGDGDGLAALATVRPAPAVLVGGPGWRADLPVPVQRVQDLAEAVEGVLRAVGVS
jgi:MerR family transcriptional regulator, light-induced transcriptional regulator